MLCTLEGYHNVMIMLVQLQHVMHSEWFAPPSLHLYPVHFTLLAQHVLHMLVVCAGQQSAKAVLHHIFYLHVADHFA